MATSGANGPGSATASASNPRKFSEKIALQKQRQAEETAAFEEVMMDIGSTRLQAQKLRLAYTRSSHYGGSLPNVNQIGCGLAEFQSPLHSPLDSSRSTRHHGLVERVQRDPRRMVSPLRRYPRHISFTEGLCSLAGSGWGSLGAHGGQRGLRCCPVPSRGSFFTLSPWKVPFGSFVSAGSCGRELSLLWWCPPSLAGADFFTSACSLLLDARLPDSSCYGGFASLLLTFLFLAFNSETVATTCLPQRLLRHSSIFSDSIRPDSLFSLPFFALIFAHVEDEGQKSSPYSPAYLSPPPESSWRRTMPWGNFPAEKGQLFRLPSALNRTSSDSALHTSVMNPSPQDTYPGPAPPSVLPSRRGGCLDGDMDSKVPAIEENLLDDKHLLKPWDAKKLSSSSSRPRSCEVPGINIFPSPDQPATVPVLPPAMNTGGSLPDLTNLHFPPPLPTPLDPEETAYPSLSGGSSTSNLTHTMTHLGISGGLALGPGYDAPGLHSPLSHPSLQSSLSNPNLQASLSSPQPQLQGSHSHPSLPASSLARHALPTTSLGHPSLSAPALSSSSSSSSASSPVLGAPPYPASAPGASPRHRRVPLSPLSLPAGPADARRSQQQLPKQFSPTMSPTLSSITQGVPLDTSKLPTDQRLPPYPYSPPSLVLPTQQHTPKPLQQPGLSSQACPVQPSGAQPPGRQLQCGALYPPSPSGHGPQSYHRSMSDFSLGNLEQFNMENPSTSLALDPPGFSEGPGFLGGEGPVSGPQDPHALNHQNVTHCSRHGSGPNIILTGDASPGFSKEIAAALAGVPGFEVSAAGLGLGLGLEEELRMEPLGLEGLSMLSDPCALLPDPAVEDSFRSDRLQ